MGIDNTGNISSGFNKEGFSVDSDGEIDGRVYAGSRSGVSEPAWGEVHAVAGSNGVARQGAEGEAAIGRDPVTGQMGVVRDGVVYT